MVAIRGGTRLTAHLGALASRLRNPGTLRVGFLEGAEYPDGTPVALVAYVQEYGSTARNIPPRPFFRNMIARHEGEWGGETGEALKSSGMDGKKALALMGQRIAGELGQSILDTNDPPLSPKTIKRKGFQKPLVDIGRMLQTSQTGWDIQEGET